MSTECDLHTKTVDSRDMKNLLLALVTDEHVEFEETSMAAMFDDEDFLLNVLRMTTGGHSIITARELMKKGIMKDDAFARDAERPIPHKLSFIYPLHAEEEILVKYFTHAISARNEMMMRYACHHRLFFRDVAKLNTTPGLERHWKVWWLDAFFTHSSRFWPKGMAILHDSAAGTMQKAIFESMLYTICKASRWGVVRIECVGRLVRQIESITVSSIIEILGKEGCRDICWSDCKAVVRALAEKPSLPVQWIDASNHNARKWFVPLLHKRRVKYSLASL